MVTLNAKAVVMPVGIVRVLEVIFSCVTFSLVASVARLTDSFWTWCMFTWCFCFCVTLLILVLEFTSLSSRLPISWDDFTTAFAMLAALMMLAVSILFASLFARMNNQFYIIAAVFSFATFILYTVEVCLTRAKPGEISGFLATIPGLLKVLEFFVACVIFACLDDTRYHQFPGLQWCVAVYSICFIFAALVIILTIGRLLAVLPSPLDKVLTGANVLAVLMYMTAVVVWPYYGFLDNPRPDECLTSLCKWNNYVVITFMTCVNLVVYIVDTVFSVRLVFFISRT